MSRPAAFMTSATGHGGTVITGSPNVFVNGKLGATVGHTVICPLHGPTAIATGRKDVLLNGKPMSRLHDKVICIGACPPGGPLIDHGKPSFSIDGKDYYLDGDWADVPQAELEALVRALESGDPQAIAKAWNDVPNKANIGKGKLKVVDPAHPNIYDEYEVTGPGGSSLGGNGVKADAKPGGGRLQIGGGPGKWGVKKTVVERYRADDGSIHERRGSISYGDSGGFSVDGEWSDRRKGISFDSPWDWGGGGEDIKIGPAETQPAIDIIVPPVSADVLLGD